MKRTLAIVSYTEDTANTYYEQIKSLFLDSINIEKFSMHNASFENGIKADLILVSSLDIYENIKRYIDKKSQIIFCNRTISKQGVQKIKEIPSGSDVYVIDETCEMAKEIISVLYETDIINLNFIPYCSETNKSLDNKFVVTLGRVKVLLGKPKKIIQIDSSILDISTIIDIGFKLDIDDVVRKRNIWTTYKDIQSANFGLSEVLGKFNKTESELDIMLTLVDDGIVGINVDGLIFTYNDTAKKIFGFSKEEVLNKEGIKLFSQIPFINVMDTKTSIKEKLIKINGDDVIVSVEPMIHSGKIYGAMCICRKFNEVEMKQHKIRSQLLGKGHKAKYRFKDICGDSEIITKCKNTAMRMAVSNSTILITGESGTGKELFAQSIHNDSKRNNYQFVAVNCGSIPESLLESELFGYEEGAFSGARRGGKLGLFELAHKGTLFLDEIGEMPMNLQMKLLRVLQEREVMRIGGDRLINIDIRLIAATNRDLNKMVEKGTFREDLFYRINVLPLKIPSLNARKEDIQILVNKFKKEFGSDFKLTQKAELALINHNWKGNIRELRNCIEHIVYLELETVDLEDLPFYENSNTKNEDFYDEKCILVLKELNQGLKENKRLGRRSILENFKERSIFVGEQEIRTILLNLEKNNMVKIHKGRKGTEITERGKILLERLRL